MVSSAGFSGCPETLWCSPQFPTWALAPTSGLPQCRRLNHRRGCCFRVFHIVASRCYSPLLVSVSWGIDDEGTMILYGPRQSFFVLSMRFTLPKSALLKSSARQNRWSVLWRGWGVSILPTMLLSYCYWEKAFKFFLKSYFERYTCPYGIRKRKGRDLSSVFHFESLAPSRVRVQN